MPALTQYSFTDNRYHAHPRWNGALERIEKICQALRGRMMSGTSSLELLKQDPGLREICDFLEGVDGMPTRAKHSCWARFPEANNLSFVSAARQDECLVIINVKNDEEWLMNPAHIKFDINGSVTDISYNTGP